MITIRTEAPIYWGVGGEYGPFDEQQTGEWAGWPDFGQVLRYFREKAGMSPSEFATTYGKETKPDGKAITGRHVSRMELDNDIPLDMNKRKLIARLLNIPPMLFGLAVLENVALKPHPKIARATTVAGHTALPKVTADITKYQRNIRNFLTLHFTSQAQSELDNITEDIRELESLEQQSRGDLQVHIQELLFSYYLLVAKVVVDQRNFSLSYHYANQAVRVAMETDDTDLIATARYTRGRTYLEWGMTGTLERGVFKVQGDKIDKAIRDFEDAKNAAENTDKNLHPQVVGLIDVHLSRAYAIRSVSTGEEIPALAITLLNSTEEKADSQPINDPFELQLVTGSLKGFVKSDYHINRAIGLTIAGEPKAALTELTKLKSLRNGRIGKHFTRNQIWLDIVTADVHMGMEEFDEATKLARRALVACRDIKSMGNFTHIIDIHGRLLKSTYKAESDVAQLGDMIDESLTARIEY